MEAVILLDYYNLERNLKGMPIFSLVSKLINILDNNNIYPKNVSLRIYGGWYKERMPTKDAQDITAKLQAIFPKIIRMNNNQKVYITAVLAKSLAEMPSLDLYGTYRMRQDCKDMFNKGSEPFSCDNENCLLKTITEALSSNNCGKNGCQRKVSEILSIREQKMVDAMIMHDLYYYSVTQGKEVVLVSADDDFWPSINMVLNCGRSITHIYCNKRSLFSESIYSKSPLCSTGRYKAFYLNNGDRA